jgi:uncharacterized membrane protein YgcG
MSSRHQSEIRYRLHRMRVLYPNVMTPESLHGVNAALDGGQSTALLRQLRDRSIAVSRIISSARVEAAASRSGTSGSTIGRSSGGGRGSSSFGGGRSSGGRGGTW